MQQHGGAEAHELAHAGVGTGGSLVHDALALSLHTAAMLAVMAAVALVVYQRLGIAVLRRAWVNFEVVWAAVLVMTGLFTLFTASGGQVHPRGRVRVQSTQTAPRDPPP